LRKPSLPSKTSWDIQDVIDLFAYAHFNHQFFSTRFSRRHKIQNPDLYLSLQIKALVDPGDKLLCADDAAGCKTGKIPA